MAIILLVEDSPDLGTYEAFALESRGHTVLRCSGAPTPYSACPMIRAGRCALADSADVIVFSCGMIAPVAGRSYRGSHLLRAYREHPSYGHKPMLVVTFGMPSDLSGIGPLRFIEKFSPPEQIIEAVESLIGQSRRRVSVGEKA